MDIERRQIWAQPTTSTSAHSSCTPFLLPSNGVLTINNSFTVTVTEDAYFQPACTGSTSVGDIIPSTIISNDPFYASVGPQLYAIGCMTVVSYVLVIILLITPRKFYIGSHGGDGNLLGRHGIISGSYSGNSSVTGVGGRPWLQKVAALSCAISLTLATIDSLHVAQTQYEMGVTDATAMTEEVIDGTELRIVRVVSSTFLWLAQVQTLIRLFPRHKEKVLIKWAGFALIVLDTIFAILDNFVSHGSETHPRLFDDAIPALSYLFELALNMLYAAWVIFYSLSKHRFAFFHRKMRNICLVATFSLSAVLIPVVFFIMDIASPDVAGWGEYIRWVGSAAASVVVWEWVERIEALERDERKDGILGREIFDGDEMLEVTPSQEVEWPRQSSPREDGNGRGTGAAWRNVIAPNNNNKPFRRGHLAFQLGAHARNAATNGDQDGTASPRQNASAPPVPPPAAVTPISRGDTISAASTDYYVRYHPVASPTPPISATPVEHQGHYEPQGKQDDICSTIVPSHGAQRQPAANSQFFASSSGWKRWLPMASLFETRRSSPPQEIATALEEEENTRDRSSDSDDDNMSEKCASPTDTSSNSRFKQTLSSIQHGEWHNLFGAAKARKPLSVTVIPSRDLSQQPWSPQPPGSVSSDRMHGAPGLPVTVIPTHGQRTSMWPSSANTGNESGSNSQLRYDPETAALVEVDPNSGTSMNYSAPDQRFPTETERTSHASQDGQMLLHRSASAFEAGAMRSRQDIPQQSWQIDHVGTDSEARQDTPQSHGSR
ncbi:pH-response regulator protein palH/RIM21 [Talaromyces atroroseus]|uniref:pH-response regulator protein palH/RIM21 n=1 Tax=Talaromyces atroroseus TaxID=1441469 RepID=A0A225ATP8_TALAT|nr:pH-response regulator protein palH/RIM21 [Talaromyces atroroseus]OKL58306.1 pH-response regulator protein palH/RIM21 [Talaromyces atroroseus]